MNTPLCKPLNLSLSPGSSRGCSGSEEIGAPKGRSSGCSRGGNGGARILPDGGGRRFRGGAVAGTGAYSRVQGRGDLRCRCHGSTVGWNKNRCVALQLLRGGVYCYSNKNFRCPQNKSIPLCLHTMIAAFPRGMTRVKSTNGTFFLFYTWKRGEPESFKSWPSVGGCKSKKA